MSVKPTEMCPPESFLKTGGFSHSTSVTPQNFLIDPFCCLSCNLFIDLSSSKCFWTVVLEKTLESPLECKEIQPVHPKGDWSWVFIGRTEVEAETPILWPPDVKSWLIGKDRNAGEDWGQEKGTTEDEIFGWHHWLNGHGFEWTPGVGDGQGGLACCGSWGHKESDTTEWLNWTELIMCSPSYLMKIIMVEGLGFEVVAYNTAEY